MKKRILFFGVLFLLMSFGFGFFLWANNSAQPLPEALQTMNSDEHVQVDLARWIVFSPTNQNPTFGVIFYPGGKVDPRAYAPAMRHLAENGYLAVITPMPLNLAIFAPNQAADVIADYPQIEGWVIGGHSLGGSMAARFVNQYTQKIDGLYFWASYPAGSDDLSEKDLAVLSIYASLDGLVTQKEINASLLLLPTETWFVQIEGGNHAQFGWYGDQPKDNPAQISRESQQEQTLQAMLEWIKANRP